MISRRTVVGNLLYASGATSIMALTGCGGSGAPIPPTTPPTGGPVPQVPIKQVRSLLSEVGPLLAPDENGVMLPLGFTSRVVARTGEAPVATSDYIWHGAPDGGAVFPTEDDGWIYASNAELNGTLGGAGALVFDADGNVIDAYPILEGTTRNCAGGPTPWGTWLSCEETGRGAVWECDPAGVEPATLLTSMGLFAHEAVAVDPKTNILYLTEDRLDGLFYRFVPDVPNVGGRPDLSQGQLQAAIVDAETKAVSWVDIADPLGEVQSVRAQAPTATAFKGGEGMVYYDNVVSFVTKFDNRVWAYQIDNNVMSVIYDRDTAENKILSGVDNVTVSFEGELVISEDGGDLQVVAITAGGILVPLAQLVGHDGSEVTGPAFSPDGKRLYFSSQRGTAGVSEGGMTFEIQGPFHS